MDCTTENLADLVTLSLERLVGTGETDQFLSHVYSLVIQHSYPILISQGATQPQHASSNIPQEIIRFLDTVLDKPVGRTALSNATTSQLTRMALTSDTQILLSISDNSASVTPEYAQKVLRFFNKLLSMGEKPRE